MVVTDTYKIIRRAPEVPEFQLLRQTLGYEELSDEAVERGLSNTLFAVCAERDSLIMGCARVIGDGGMYFFIEDLMVLPGLEDPEEAKSIVSCMMDEVMSYLRQNAPQNAFFCIKDSKKAQDYCKQFGFRINWSTPVEEGLIPRQPSS